MSNKTCIVLVGPPCSGKSVTGKLTASKMNINYISSGDIARDMAKVNTQIYNDLSAGKMAPEEMMRNTISDRLWKYFIKEDRNVVILDGFPRFGDQIEWLYSRVKDSNINIKFVLFNIPLSTIIERSANRNRDDDKSLEQRLRYYYNITYRELYKYINMVIDANENTIEECSELLTKYIEEVSNR